MKLGISSAILGELQQLAVEDAPDEICGLLFGENNVVTAYRPTANIADIPSHYFEIDPAKLIAAERAMRKGGPKVIGYYHSHPSGTVEPSKTDAAGAASDDRLWLILNGHDAAAWQAKANGEIYDRFTPIALDCS